MAEKTLHFQNPRLLSQLYCSNDENLRSVENAFDVSIVTRDDWLQIEGANDGVAKAESLFELLNRGRAQGLQIRNGDFQNLMQAVAEGQSSELLDAFSDESLVFRFRRKSIVPKTINQKKYVRSILEQEIVFGIGPAGTGKTYLAVAAALDALLKEKVQRLILTRPAVEAGEALGFLPGDLQEKIQPYLRPLYDAMFEMLGKEHCERLAEKGVLEIAPLAYMRGRTLSDSFIVLDEAQNTTPEQMMMFLTRLGENSRMVITGDITQIDLPRHKFSGLKEAVQVLPKVPGIKFHFFEGIDVVRNPLVQRIIEAYDRYIEATGAHQHKE